VKSDYYGLVIYDIDSLGFNLNELNELNKLNEFN